MKKKTVLIRGVVISFMFIIFTITPNYVYADESNNELTLVEKITHEIFGDIEIESTEYLYGLDETIDFVCVDFKDKGYIFLL